MGQLCRNYDFSGKGHKRLQAWPEASINGYFCQIGEEAVVINNLGNFYSGASYKKDEFTTENLSIDKIIEGDKVIFKSDFQGFPGGGGYANPDEDGGLIIYRSIAGPNKIS